MNHYLQKLEQATTIDDVKNIVYFLIMDAAEKKKEISTLQEELSGLGEDFERLEREHSRLEEDFHALENDFDKFKNERV